MNRGKYLEPNFQKFWKEIIEKEQSIRLKWHAKYDPFLKRVGMGIDPDRTSSDDEEESEDELPLREPRIKAEPLPRIEAPSPPPTPTTEIEPWDIPEPSYTSMKPVCLHDRALIYDGISKEGLRGKGRAQYLRSRKKLGPENKYYHPVASSWEHGWCYGRNVEPQHPEHARVNIVKQTFFRRNGIRS
ncbi:uncharacterized protein [Centruroides vittatus]|uniref:uncharacterized protein n=1 Tax=Centruroides vittatus TaxID=120091 RepID=UPI00350FB347